MSIVRHLRCKTTIGYHLLQLLASNNNACSNRAVETQKMKSLDILTTHGNNRGKLDFPHNSEGLDYGVSDQSIDDSEVCFKLRSFSNDESNDDENATKQCMFN